MRDIRKVWALSSSRPQLCAPALHFKPSHEAKCSTDWSPGNDVCEQAFQHLFDKWLRMHFITLVVLFYNSCAHSYTTLNTTTFLLFVLLIQSCFTGFLFFPLLFAQSVEPLRQTGALSKQGQYRLQTATCRPGADCKRLDGQRWSVEMSLKLVNISVCKSSIVIWGSFKQAPRKICLWKALAYGPERDTCSLSPVAIFPTTQHVRKMFSCTVQQLHYTECLSLLYESFLTWRSGEKIDSKWKQMWKSLCCA